MNIRIKKVLAGLLVLLLAGFLTTAVSAGETVQKSSSASVEQSASVSGGSSQIEQESTVRAETDDTVVEQHAERSVTKEAGEPAQVEEDVDRRVVNPNNESVTYDVDQTLQEGEDSISSSQHVTQGIEDVETDVEAVESEESIESAAAETNTDTETTASAQAHTETEVSPLQQGGSFTLLMQTIDALTDLFSL